VDTPRANLTRICSNAARHIVESSSTSSLALASDLVEAHRLMPHVSIEWLVAGMVMLPDDHRADLIASATDLKARQPNV
jgi:hypothetical protein